jgi:hypothetical protein
MVVNKEISLYFTTVTTDSMIGIIYAFIMDDSECFREVDAMNDVLSFRFGHSILI